MVVDKLQLFLGKPLCIANDEKNEVYLYSPTIKDIGDIGEYRYQFQISFATFNKDLILKLMNEEDSEFLNPYDFITNNISFIDCVEKSLSFFVKEKVIFNQMDKDFKVNNISIVNRENFEQISDLIKITNGLKNEDKQLKFRNEKAKQMYLKMQELKKKHEEFKKKNGKEDGLSLKDILSILCNAEGNGINIFNIQNLTIYQVYEHFERMTMKESHKRILPVWANGHLGENDKLPEWIQKSKM